MQPNEPIDVAIVGAGLVGASLAAALRDAPLRIALIEARPPAGPAGWDSRIYALSAASRAFLESIGVWQLLPAERLSPVRRMAIFGGSGSRLGFSAHDAGVAELACIVESGALARALWSGLARQHNLELICPASLLSLQAATSPASVQLDTGRTLRARLVVGADGALSFVRRAAGITDRVRPYGQLGVVANFGCERPHRGTAFQWFRDDGVLAWLPLPGERMSMVWSTPEALGQELLALAPHELCRRVSAAGNETLGGLELLSAAAAFPLTWLNVNHRVVPRIALIGDAAHVIHPLAGQGVNLGFGDAAELARLLCTLKPGSDAGDIGVLRRFERARAEAILAMGWVTDGLARLFGSRAETLGRLRNWGLNSVDNMPVIKTLLVRHALGLP